MQEIRNVDSSAFYCKNILFEVKLVRIVRILAAIGGRGKKSWNGRVFGVGYCRTKLRKRVT